MARPRVGPYHGVIFEGLRSIARTRVSGPEPLFCGSWQPEQDWSSPGMTVSQLRISCRARPCASSGWSETGVLAGISKYAEPSASTGTVPMMRTTSQGPSNPTRSVSEPMPRSAKE